MAELKSESKPKKEEEKTKTERKNQRARGVYRENQEGCGCYIGTKVIAPN